MTNAMPYIGIGALLVVGLVVRFLIRRRRHRRDYREHLEPILAERGLKFVSATYPGMFKIGPFPKFEIEVGRPYSHVCGSRGEYCEYRIVTFSDSEGKTHQVWAQVEFEMFRFRRVRWRAENKEHLPASAKALLEN
jgi:hypothetical protein